MNDDTIKDIVREAIPDAKFHAKDNRTPRERRAANLLRDVEELNSEHSIVISDLPELSPREEFLQDVMNVLAIMPEMLELAKEIRKEMKKASEKYDSKNDNSVRAQLYQFGMERVSDPGIHLMQALEVIEQYATRIKQAMEAV